MNGKPKEIYQKYTFSIRGRGTLQQVTQLLYEFYQGGHIHKITSVALNPIAGGKQIDVSLSIEALGLTRCEREGELSTAKANRLAASDLSAYQSVVHRNLFSQEAAGTLRNVKLTAVTFDRTGTPGAWFSLGPDVQTQVLTRGETLSLPGHQIEVIDIQPRLVLVDVNGQVARLTLGKTIHEALAPLTRVAEKN
jgi:hypothetical protein